MEPTRFADLPARLLGGIRRQHGFATAAQTIPPQWQEFMAMPPLPGRIGHVTYGVMCGASREGFEYMCAMEVADLAALPDGIGRMRVPAQHYAVFVYDGHASGIGLAWDAAFRGWLPRSAFADAETPAFERYDERYDVRTASGITEIWLPVRPR